METLALAAETGDEGGLTTQTFAFHLAALELAEHRRMTEIYRSLSLQIQLCMSFNRRVRRDTESAAGNAARHRELLSTIESGDRDAVHAALAAHGHRSFVPGVAHRLGGASDRSRRWLAELGDGPSVG